jgi:autotransporter-associated beta strand protein
MNGPVGWSRAALKLGLSALVVFFASQLRAQTVTVTRNFNDGVNVSTFAPPDSDGAVGPNNFIEFINGSYIVYDKTVAHNALLNISDTAFWQGVNNPPSQTLLNTGLSDTHIIYDYLSQRYFAVEITTANTGNSVLIARTNGPGVDPTVLSNWTATSYVGRASNRFADFPMVGIDANALYIDTNNFNGNTSTDRTITSIPKSDLLLATPSLSRKTSSNSSSNFGWSPMPVVDFSPTKGAAVVVGVPNTISNSTTLPYIRINGTSGAGATFPGTINLSVPTFNFPPNPAPQPDGTADLDNGDGRMPNHGYQVGNDIWFVHAVQGSGATSARSVLRWYRMGYNGGGTPTLIASGTLQDNSGHYDYYNPSIAANAYGDVAISFTRSGDSTTGTSGNAGAYGVVGFTSGTTTTFGSPITLQGGLTGAYHIGGPAEGRWGDFSQVSVDPNDQGAFWLINEYVVNGTTWADNISALRVGRSITWNGSAGNGQWTTASNWNIAPLNGADLVFAGSGASPVPTNNSDLTSIGSITFDNTAAAYTLNGSGTGASVLLLFGITNNSANTQTVNFNLTLNDAQQFNAASAPLIVNGAIATAGKLLTVTGAQNVTLAGTVSGSGSLTKTGSGILTISGGNSYSGGTTVNAGRLVAASPTALGTGGLTINNSAKTVLQPGLTAPVQLPSLTIAGGASPTATLDMTNNNMIVHNGDISAIHDQLKSGLIFGGTLWSGPGITSSTAAADAAAHSNETAFAVGAIRNVDKNGAALYSTWPASPSPDAGVSGLTTSDVLMKYTYFGDANLDGVTDNTTDYDLWSTGFTNPGLAATNGWLYGDFDYSGVVDNTTDYDLWSTGFTHQGVPLAASNIESVPEPGSIFLAALGALSCTILIRRSRIIAKIRRQPALDF